MAISLCGCRTDRQGRELAKHGTVLFPAACYKDELPGEYVPWHWHDELEAIILTEGRVLVAVEDKRLTVKQGEGIFINAGVLHAMWDEDGGGCHYRSAVFHPRLVGGSIDSIFWQNYIQPLTENISLKYLHIDGSATWHKEAVREVDTAWRECAAERPGYEFRVRASLSQLVFLLSSYHPAVVKRPSEKALRDGKRIKTMIQYIQEHCGEELSTAGIAQSAMISESECLRCFRSTVGVPPIQYVKQFRVQRAAELLTATEQKIADVAAQCGFQDMSYFTKTFRGLRGCTPTEYRKRQGK